MLRRVSILCCLALLTVAAVSPERGIFAAPRTVAVLYFDNYTGKADYDPLGKGISSMMISDLSPVKEIQLVERERMQDLLKEIDLQHTKYFDSTTVGESRQDDRRGVRGGRRVRHGGAADAHRHARRARRDGRDREERAGHGRSGQVLRSREGARGPADRRPRHGADGPGGSRTRSRRSSRPTASTRCRR